MSDDDTRRLLQRSLAEGGMANPDPLDADRIAERVGAARRRPLLVGAAVAVVALAAVAVWRTGVLASDPTVTQPNTEASEPPSEGTSSSTETASAIETPTDAGEIPTGAVLADVSDAVFGECGEVFAPPDRTSELVIESGPSEPLAETGGAWRTTVRIGSDELVQAPVAMDQLIVVDGEGRVVASPDPDSGLFFGEGPRWMGLAAGASIETTIVVPAACETGDWLPPGDYQAYGALTFVDGEDYEQAQGGPWPITIGGGAEVEATATIPDGAVTADLECGATWTDPQPSTGFELELLDQIRTPREASDDIDGRALISVTAAIDATVFSEVVVLRDGVVVNHMPGTDDAQGVTATAGTTVPEGFDEQFFDCDVPMTDATPLQAGEYEVVVVVLAGGDGPAAVIATTPRIPLTLT